MAYLGFEADRGGLKYRCPAGRVRPRLQGARGLPGAPRFEGRILRTHRPDQAGQVQPEDLHADGLGFPFMEAGLQSKERPVRRHPHLRRGPPRARPGPGRTTPGPSRIRMARLLLFHSLDSFSVFPVSSCGTVGGLRAVNEEVCRSVCRSICRSICIDGQPVVGILHAALISLFRFPGSARNLRGGIRLQSQGPTPPETNRSRTAKSKQGHASCSLPQTSRTNPFIPFGSDNYPRACAR